VLALDFTDNVHALNLARLDAVLDRDGYGDIERCQYVYLGTSKASTSQSVYFGTSLSGVSSCTFALVKQVN